MGPAFVATCLAQVITYDDFNEDNDPYGTHEMGFMEIMGRKVWFKIDLYDETYQYGTPRADRFEQDAPRPDHPIPKRLLSSVPAMRSGLNAQPAQERR